MAEADSFVYQIGPNYYWIEVWMYNYINPPYALPFFFIEDLVFEETLWDWNTTGYITIANFYEFLERGGITNPEDPKAPYVFRTDGRNKIHIKIKPCNPPASEQIGDNDMDQLNPEFWHVDYDFVVYDIQDLDSGDPSKKLKTLYFKDERHQILSERNVEWSTAEAATGLKDIDRTQPVSEAILALLNKVAYSGSKDALNVGFDTDGSIDKPNIPFDSYDDNWELGLPEQDLNGRIFYTSTAHTNALMDLNNILDCCVSSKGFPVILDHGRSPGDKLWKLTCMSKYFDKSLENQIEHLFIDEPTDSSNLPPKLERASNSTSDPTIQNFNSATASKISNYEFSQMSPVEDLYIANNRQVSFDFATGSYNMFTNTLDGLKAKVSDLIKSLYSQTNGSGGLILSSNKTKTSGLTTYNNFVPGLFANKNASFIKMMKNLIFMGQAIAFDVPGLLFRCPGKFVFIDRVNASGSNPFDDRFLGQWFVVKTTHQFTKQSYYTHVVATKIDSYSKLFESKETAY